MKCESMEQDLVSLLYGELEPEEAKRIHKHLKDCPSCNQAYEALQSTSKILQKWEDVTPRMNLVFVDESASRWKLFIEKIQQLSWGRRLALGVPAVAAVIFLFLGVLNFRAGHEDGKWNVAFSLVPQKEQTFQEERFVEALKNMQSENMMLVSKMIEESEIRQRRESTLTLAEYARELERQRQEDLRMVGQGLEGLQRTTNGRFQQHSNVLDNIIRLTSYKLQKK